MSSLFARATAGVVVGVALAMPAWAHAPWMPGRTSLPDSLRYALRAAAARDSGLAGWQRETMERVADERPTLLGPPGNAFGHVDGQWQSFEPPTPMRRDGPSAVLDPTRRRLILFGGYDSSIYRDDVWTMALDPPFAWTRLAVAGTPPAGRSLHAAIYDPIGDRVIVHGGFRGGELGDLWGLELSGEPTWTPLTAAGPDPGPRYGHTGAYDPNHGRLLLYGGLRGDHALSDLWELDLTGPLTWRVLQRPHLPASGFAYFASVPDAASHRVLVIGGDNGNGTYSSDVLEFDPRDQTWGTLQTTGTPFIGRTLTAAALDPVSHRCVVFGGLSSGGATLGDTWVLDLAAGGATWTNVSVATPPSPRYGASLSWDPDGGRYLLFGGINGSSAMADAYELRLGVSPLAWKALAFPGGSPPVRAFHSAIEDAARHRIVVFGGWNGFSVLQDVWTLDLATTSWTARAPAGLVPSGRDGHTAVYDPASDRMLVFAGNDGGARLNDTWAYDLGSDQWTALDPPGGPPPARFFHGAVVDPIANAMIVWGGDQGGSPFTVDSWSLSLGPVAAWSRPFPADRPRPRGLHAALFDAGRDRLVLHGGFQGLNDWMFHGDAWAWSETQAQHWQRIDAPGGTVPAARDGHTLALDAAGDRYLMFGGNADGAMSNELFALDPNTGVWSAIAVASPSPEPRFQHAALLDAVARRWIVFGGQQDSRWHSDTWSLALQGTPAWTELHPAVIWPQRQIGGILLHDPKRDRILSFFDRDQPIWALSLTAMTWSPIAADGPVPAGRTWSSAAYDPVQDRFLFFGGVDDTGLPTNRLWELRMQGAPTWAELHPTGETPAHRANAVLEMDTRRNRLILFGGDSDFSFLFGDLWELSLESLAWRRLEPPGARPTARTLAAAVRDPNRDRLVMFGGRALPSEQPTDEVWELELGDDPVWARLETSEPAPALEGARAVYDAKHRRMLVFGGFGGDLRRDVWALSLKNHAAWSRLVTDGSSPAGRVYHGLAPDPSRGRFVTWAGYGGGSGVPLMDLAALSWKPPVVNGGRQDPLTGLESDGRSIALAAVNPARGRLTVRLALPAQEAGTLELLDVAGRRLGLQTIAPGDGSGREVTVNDRALTPGVYFVRARAAGQERIARAVVVD